MSIRQRCKKGTGYGQASSGSRLALPARSVGATLAASKTCTAQ